MWLPLLLGALASPAQECPAPATCSRLAVPLDRTGRTPGTIPLAYARIAATGTRTGTVVILAGGPGQAAVDHADAYAEVLAPVREHHDLVLIDQRGSGGSGAVDCTPEEVLDGAACAAKLGVKREHFTTPETVADVEAVRAAVGAEQIALFGISYGTEVAEAYARRYPARTQAIVLDSPVYPGGPSGLNLETIRSYARVLRGVCTGACRRTVGDPALALARAVRRLQRGPLRGAELNRQGRSLGTLTVTEPWLLVSLQGTDAHPYLRALLPAAIASLARGDAAPFLHALNYFPPDTGLIAHGNDARLLATACIEGELPWDPASPIASRSAALRSFVAGLGPAPFGPFSTEAGVEASLAPLCARWPPTPRPPVFTEPLPDVPVLVLSGLDDQRTPTEDAHRVAAQYARATVLEFPGVGHSVMKSDGTECVDAVIARFLDGQPVRPCDTEPAVEADRYRPKRMRGTLAAVRATIEASFRDRDTMFPWFGMTGEQELPALRSGYVLATRKALELHNAEVVSGVRVSGRMTNARTGRLTVAGRGTYVFRGGRVIR